MSMAQSLEQLAYELSVASISQQQARETELRSRTVLVRLARWYTAAVAFVGLEILLWTVSVKPNPPPKMPKVPPPGFGFPEKPGSIPGDPMRSR